MKKLLFLISVIVLTAGHGWSQAFVNSAEGHVYDGSTSTTIATNSFNVTVGNHLDCFVRDGSSTDNGTLSDTAGNSFTQLTNDSANGSNQFTEFYSDNVSGNASDVVT